MAKPIVSTDVGDVPLYVKDGENGFIVPIGDVSLLADRVGQILQDSIKRKHFGKISRQIALQNFDILNCGERHLEAYQLLSSK
jgi:glycosyltransferase involved in cell wall biosynthesis